ncbi:MAG: FxsA family protein [Pseudomonadota bacterium]
MWLFLLFVAVPLIEIALFIQIGGVIGLGPTLAIVIATAAIGTYLVRAQGSQAILRLRHSFENLQDPTGPLAHGAMILFSGALLLTPGFFTDAVGFALLVPAVRNWLVREIGRRIELRRFDMGPGQRRPQSGDIIEGEYEQEETQPESPSGWTRH